MSPMVDGWMGDDWFHYGAYRQTNRLLTGQTAARGAGGSSAAAMTTTRISGRRDRPELARPPVSAVAVLAQGRREPRHDAFWREQRSTRRWRRPLAVPTMWIRG
jgi:predicted acyl esterase